MRTIYANRPLLRRLNGSVVVVIIAFGFGIWELWRLNGASADSFGLMFALLFIGGGIYAMRQLLVENGSMVVSIGTDGSEATVAVWRPFRSRRIEGALSSLENWRFEVKTERRLSIPMLVADHPGFAKPLHMELGKGIVVTDELRALAPEAMAEYEKPGA